MCNERGKKVGVLSALITGLIAKAVPMSYADEGAGEGGEPPAPVNYEDLIAKARKEEKDKLYGEITKYKDQLKTMTKSNNDNLIRIGTLEKENETLNKTIVDLRNSTGETEAIANLNTKIADLERENNELKEAGKNIPDENALREQIRAELEAEYAVKLYRTEKLASDEVKNGVLPMFISNITGATNEEIDASIQKAIEMTKQAREQLGIAVDTGEGGDTGAGAGDGSGAGAGAGSGDGGWRPPKAGITDPTKNAFGNGGGLDYVQGLDPSSPEYADWRKKNGLK